MSNLLRNLGHGLATLPYRLASLFDPAPSCYRVRSYVLLDGGQLCKTGQAIKPTLNDAIRQAEQWDGFYAKEGVGYRVLIDYLDMGAWHECMEFPDPAYYNHKQSYQMSWN